MQALAQNAGTAGVPGKSGQAWSRVGALKGERNITGAAGPGSIPLHPLLVPAIRKHTLRGQVSHQGHGGIGTSLEPGWEEGGHCFVK